MPVIVARQRACAILCFVLLAPATSLARPVRLYTFNLDRSAIYTVTHNGAIREQAAPSRAGSLALSLDASIGQAIIFSAEANPDLQPPPPPTFSRLEMSSDDCLTANWLASSDPSVTRYLVSYGTRSVANGQASSYEHTVDVGAATSASACDLPAGRYFVAVRAVNYLDVVSAYSVEHTVDLISLSVAFAAFDVRAEDDRVRLAWEVAADEPLRGFRVYRWTGTATVAEVIASNLSVDATSLEDTDVAPATSYRYMVAAIREDGSEARSATVAVQTPTRVLSLGQNSPNPFNPSTRIPFTLPASSRVTLRIYDVRGAAVATLLDRTLPGGSHSVTWGGVDSQGLTVASGTYFCVLTAGNRQQSRKLVLLK